MKRRVWLLQACVIGVALSIAGLLSSSAFAQTAPSKSDAWAQAEPVPYWWFHGTIEAGGRFFLNNPSRSRQVYLGQDSLAKFYEYRDLRPGPIGNIWISTGSKDGLYQVDIGGKNIGYDDQSYYFDASKAGEHYLNFNWDQSPHLYSTTARTPYFGFGTDKLTLPGGLLSNTVTDASRITGYLQPSTDIGIKRDTASVEYRWTPIDAWDFKADYSNLRRTGTQVDGVVGLAPKSATGGPAFNPSAFGAPVQVAKPVADTTQNYGLNGEYVGTSPWDQRFSFKLAYNGSQYTDDYSSYTIQNPYCTGATTATCASTTGTILFSPFARLSLPPSNNMNALSGTIAADLPWQSRYVGTVSYDMMRQDAAFIPMTSNPSATAAAQALPAPSLNGAIDTVLSNNVVTTKITSELTSKLTYRYYNFDNRTPELLFPSWVSYDHTSAAGAGTEAAIRSLSISYTKQNASEQLNWRPSREWNLGTEFGYERYSWQRDAADVTNEYSGKLFADWKPATWFTVRSSGYYSNRRYDNYDYQANVAAIQFPGRSPDGWFVNSAYRQMMTDNRERWKANGAVDIVVLPRVTVTPNFKYQDDYYGLNRANQLGLTDSTSWNAGVDVTYIINPRSSVMVGYLYERYNQLVYNFNSTSGAGGPSSTGGTGTNLIETRDRTAVNTFTGLIRYAAIPDKLDTELRYTASRAVDDQYLLAMFGAPTNGQFPAVTTWFQRLDATATYKFDKETVALLGWKGEVKAKLHYAWESNAVSNWANDWLTPWYSPVPNAIWLGYDNPNYNIQMMMASLAFTW